MTLADQRFVRGFTDFLLQEVGQAINSLCIYTFDDPFLGHSYAFYAVTTSNSIVCGHFLYYDASFWPFRSRWKTRDHRFRTIHGAKGRDLFEMLKLDPAVVLEPEEWKCNIPRDSGCPSLYLQIGEHEKVFHERAIFGSEVVGEFARELEKRVMEIVQDATTVERLIGDEHS